MYKRSIEYRTFCLLLCLFILLVFADTLCEAAQISVLSNIANDELGKTAASGTTSRNNGFAESIWDSSKYISIDEIKPGMKAYCLTCYKGTEIEKFDLDVISVVRNIEPNRDAILVQGTDKRFIYTGPVAGCSGSPVYINDRLAGAMAFAWPLSKDPLYGVTPIKEMLRVSSAEKLKYKKNDFAFDFSRPINFAEIDRKAAAQKAAVTNSVSDASILPCPLIISGLPPEACEKATALLEPYGLIPVSGFGGNANTSEVQNVQLAPGSVLTIPLVHGDIEMAVLGTVTEIVDDRVYGFGHSMLGYGAVDLPMATGQVHTIVSNLSRSFKLGSPIEIVGALTTDEPTAVFGRIGAKAQMIPLTIKINRFNAETRIFNCRLAHNQLLTADLLHSVVYGAVLSLGAFPPDHTIEYKVAIRLQNGKSIDFENMSTELGMAEVIAESKGSVLLLLNNPFEEVGIKSFDFDIRILPKNISSHIWSVDLSDSTVKAGQQIQVDVVLESYFLEKKKYQFSLKIPEGIKPGKYELIVSGSSEYEQHLRKNMPYKFMAYDMTTLIEALNDALRIDRDRLYCLLVLPPGGIAVERAELPDLPATKTLIMQDATRSLKIQPYPIWLEKSLRTGTIIVTDRKTMHITVEE
ncbi:MAG: hypothetical protein A2167_00615 [Planctomycetes bacterium RBG_13_46_10]|nr:MAG: hypothetical protein A2167_00615 [Planctomycetes bacterium RBG_13_46_10]